MTLIQSLFRSLYFTLVCLCCSPIIMAFIGHSLGLLSHPILLHHCLQDIVMLVLMVDDSLDRAATPDLLGFGFCY